MGRIIRNGIEYGSGNENATNINYDSAISGLEATTVQAAVDEVVNGLGGLEFAIIDGKPQWKERGADSFSPFKSGGNFELINVQSKYASGNTQTITISHTSTGGKLFFVESSYGHPDAGGAPTSTPTLNGTGLTPISQSNSYTDHIKMYEIETKENDVFAYNGAFSSSGTSAGYRRTCSVMLFRI